MSSVVGLDRLDQVSQEVQQAFGDQLWRFRAVLGMDLFTKLGIHKAWGLAQLMEIGSYIARSWPLGIVE